MSAQVIAVRHLFAERGGLHRALSHDLWQDGAQQLAQLHMHVHKKVVVYRRYNMHKNATLFAVLYNDPANINGPVLADFETIPGDWMEDEIPTGYICMGESP
jgi:hypothetical protein